MLTRAFIVKQAAAMGLACTVAGTGTYVAHNRIHHLIHRHHAPHRITHRQAVTLQTPVCAPAPVAVVGGGLPQGPVALGPWVDLNTYPGVPATSYPPSGFDLTPNPPGIIGGVPGFPGGPGIILPNPPGTLPGMGPTPPGTPPSNPPGTPPGTPPGNPGTPTPAPSLPEPGTWAMVILGMGAVGVVMRRQTSRAATA